MGHLSLSFAFYGEFITVLLASTKPKSEDSGSLLSLLPEFRLSRSCDVARSDGISITVQHFTELFRLSGGVLMNLPNRRLNENDPFGKNNRTLRKFEC